MVLNIATRDSAQAEPEDDAWIVEYGLARREQAQAAVSDVEILLLRGRTAEAEDAARRSLHLFASSLNWLEDTSEFERAHELMDTAGRYVRLTFGCQFHWQGEYYEQRCPVALAHKRIGFSPELIVRQYVCSICSCDPVACPHISGRVYGGVICTYRPRGFEPLGGVALVNRPAQPDARIQAMPMTVPELRRILPTEWRPGDPVYCNRCLHPCPGVEEVDLEEMALVHQSDGETAETSPPITVTLMLADTPMLA